MTPQALRASSPCQGELWVVYSPTRRASRGPLRRLRRQLTLQGSLWRLRIWVLREPSFLAAVSRLAARGRAGVARPWDSKGKSLLATYVPRHNVASPMPAHRSRRGRAGCARGQCVTDESFNAGLLLGDVTGRQAWTAAQREVSHCLRAQPGGESEGRFLLSPQKKAPLRKNKNAPGYPEAFLWIWEFGRGKSF